MTKLEGSRDLKEGNTTSLPVSDIKKSKKKYKQSVQRKYWSYTYFYSDKDKLEFLETIKLYFKKFRIGYEKCPSSGKLHMQGFGETILKGGLRLEQLIKYFEKYNSPHFQACLGSEEQNDKYCSKEGDSITYGYPKEIKYLKDNELRPFQKALEDIILGPVNEGKIVWVYDSVGQLGKTQLVRRWNIKYKIPFSYGGKCADIINLVFNNKEYFLGDDKCCMVYNFGREVENDKISYKSMEQVSDGAISNTKFEANCFVMNAPHVIVLSNCLPLFDKLTANRWIVKTIDPKTFELEDWKEEKKKVVKKRLLN